MIQEIVESSGEIAISRQTASYAIKNGEIAISHQMASYAINNKLEEALTIKNVVWGQDPIKRLLD